MKIFTHRNVFFLIGWFAVSQVQANFIPDPGFESGSSGYLWGGSTVVSSNVHSGSYAAELKDEDVWGGGYEITISGLTPSTTYTFSAYVKNLGAGGAIGVKNYGSSQITESFDSATYVQVELQFTTGSGSTSATCFVFNDVGGSNLLYADNLSLVEGTVAPPASMLPPLDPLPVATGAYELVFSDEFNTDGSFDTTKWTPEIGFKRNNEDQYYRAENITQTGGNLVITAKREQFLNANYEAGSSDWRKNREYASWTSGSILTSESFHFLYGKIECRAKVSNLTGTWPAIWTVGAGQEWPAGGEIDIMENYGGKILGNFATAASGQYNASWDSANVLVSSLGAGWVDDFHVWELEWSPTHAEIRLDGAVINTFDPSTTNSGSSHAHPGVAPFQTFGQLLWLNLAIGGNAGGNPSGLPDETVYLVDYIRVYQRQHPEFEARLELLDTTFRQVDFQSTVGRRYSVLESNDLSDNENWTEVSNVRGTGSMMTLLEQGALGAGAKFYTVEVDNAQWIDPATP